MHEKDKKVFELSTVLQVHSIGHDIGEKSSGEQNVINKPYRTDISKTCL